jgi:4-hydroxy-4-methyl-2-oxoglutarate aldolase
MIVNEIASRLLVFDSCALSDALDSLGLPGVATCLIATSPGKRVAGRVHTCKLALGKPPTGAPARHLGAASIDAAVPGDIIVVEQRTGCEAGCWGGVLSHAARQKGISAIIADGLLRDVDEVRDLGLPVFCRGFTALTARGRVHEAATEVPIAVGDLTVNPGDYALADSSACVFIAPANVKAVIEAATRIAAREAEMIRRIHAGETASAVLGANYEHMLEKVK